VVRRPASSKIHNLRDWTYDRAFGGGEGMVLPAQSQVRGDTALPGEVGEEKNGEAAVM